MISKTIVNSIIKSINNKIINKIVAVPQGLQSALQFSVFSFSSGSHLESKSHGSIFIKFNLLNLGLKYKTKDSASVLRILNSIFLLVTPSKIIPTPLSSSTFL